MRQVVHIHYCCRNETCRLYRRLWNGPGTCLGCGWRLRLSNIATRSRP